jgi:hypothetical protein
MFRTVVVAVVAAAAAAAFVPPAAGAGEGAKAKDAPASAFTLGVVQKGLRPGLSQADVAERLGAPNILTRDAEGREAWVYDKVSTENEASSRSVGVGGGGSGVGSTFAGLLGIRAGMRSDKAKSSQRTLTVVVRFSAAGTVDGFTWHDSQF